ncbi:hypothetical protein [Hydrogenimonas sp.]
MKRQAIIDNLKARLKTITVANGYTWEPNLFEWLVTPLGKHDLPALILKDTDDDITHDYPSGSSDHSLKIEIEIYAADERMTAESLRSKVLDVLRVIGAPEEEGEYLGDYRSVTGTEMQIEQNESIVGAARIDLSVKYYTEAWGM